MSNNSPQAYYNLGSCYRWGNGVPKDKAKAKERTIEEKTILIIRDAELAVLHKRPAKGLLAGMYEFPSMKGFCTAEEVKEYLTENGLQVLRIQPLEDAKHVFSHREWHMKGYLIRVDELAPKKAGPDSADWIYIEPRETKDRYPIPSAFAAYAKGLSMQLGIPREEG